MPIVNYALDSTVLTVHVQPHRSIRGTWFTSYNQNEPQCCSGFMIDKDTLTRLALISEGRPKTRKCSTGTPRYVVKLMSSRGTYY